MTQDDEALLDAQGWDVECQSPLEIRHRETGSFATLWAADYVLQMLRQEHRSATAPALPDSVAEQAVELRELCSRLRRVAAVAQEHQEQAPQAWDIAYSLVFSPTGSQRVRALLDALNLSFDYYDPDADYRDDVLAYVTALEDLQKRIEPFLQALAAVD